LRSIFTEVDDAALLESRVAGESLAREPGSASRGSASEKEACNHGNIERRVVRMRGTTADRASQQALRESVASSTNSKQ